LLPLVCAADLTTANEVLQKNRICWSYVCCAVEREQAPSPRVISWLFVPPSSIAIASRS